MYLSWKMIWQMRLHLCDEKLSSRLPYSNHFKMKKSFSLSSDMKQIISLIGMYSKNFRLNSPFISLSCLLDLILIWIQNNSMISPFPICQEKRSYELISEGQNFSKNMRKIRSAVLVFLKMKPIYLRPIFLFRARILQTKNESIRSSLSRRKISRNVVNGTIINKNLLVFDLQFLYFQYRNSIHNPFYEIFFSSLIVSKYFPKSHYRWKTFSSSGSDSHCHKYPLSFPHPCRSTFLD